MKSRDWGRRKAIAVKLGWRKADCRAIGVGMVIQRHKSYWRNINPTGAIGDFVTVFRQARGYRWRFALLAVVCTAMVFSLIVFEEARIEPRPPEIIYINSWRPGRSDAEIHASNLVNQQRKEREAAEQAVRDQQVKDIYKALGRVSGMDVDAIEAKAKADAAAEARAADMRVAKAKTAEAHNASSAASSAAPAIPAGQ